MNLRTKVLLAVAVLFAAMVAVFSVISFNVILKGFAEVERDSVRQGVDRVIQALNDRGEGMDKTVKDWAWWDDVYAFVKDGDEQFILSNLAIESMEEIEVDLIAFIGTSGRVVYAARIDRTRHLLLPMTAGLQDVLAGWRIPTESTSQKGLILVPEGPMLVASRPILTSQQKGPSRGALVMGRFLDAAEVEHLGNVTRSSIRIERMDDPALPTDFVTAKKELNLRSSVFVRIMGGDSIAGYAEINDLNGRPALLLRVDMARPIMSHARKALVTNIMYVVAAGLVFSVIVIIHLKKLVLARLLKLSTEVTRIGFEGVSAAQVSVEGSDELSGLASNINRMLSGLDKSSRDLEQAREELERRVKERTAQLEEANRELESFSYSVSHDLRAPLRAIDGFSQVVLEACAGKMDEETSADLERIRAAAQRMGRLIDSLLSLSRMSRRELRRERVDLSQVARSVVHDFQKKVPGREASITIEDGLVAEGDPELLRIVLENLLENAFKFTSKHAQATIEFGSTTQDGRKIFFIRDNGAGFDMAYADKLFGAFQRLHTEKEFEGTGIGLAIVQRIVRRHGGDVWAEGAVGNGAMFRFTL